MNKMTSKGCLGSVVMAATALLGAFLAYLLVEGLFYGAFQQIQDYCVHHNCLTTIPAVLGALLVLSLIPAAWIFLLDERHYGGNAWLRWLIAGLLFGALLSPLSNYLPGGEPDDPLLVGALYRLIRSLVGLGLSLVIYWLVFRLPARRAA